MERRLFRRIPVQIIAEVEISLDDRAAGDDHPCRPRIGGLVNTVDIGLGGFSVKITHSWTRTDKSFGPGCAYMLVNKTITAYFKEKDLRVSGKVVRVDPKTMLMAVVITKVSDIDLWRLFCGQDSGNELARR